MNFKISLKGARCNLGYSLKQAAERFGIHYLTLSNYESDSTDVPRSFFIQIESVYGISTEDIYFGKHSDYIEEFQENLLLKNA